MTFLKFLAVFLSAIVLLGFGVWSFGALWFDFPLAPKFTASLFAVILLGMVVWKRRAGRWIPLVFILCACVMLWWFSLRPSHDREWQTPVSRLPYATIEQGVVTVHDVRDFSFSETGEYTPRWITRRFLLKDIEALDIVINYWGLRWIAHPILSFQIRGQDPLCFSIETRRERGEEYSAVGGFFRRYELIVIAGTERDLFGIRINPSAGEELFLYRTSADSTTAAARFLEMVELMNAIRKRPKWYNAVTTNCTTALRSGAGFRSRIPMDWRLLINGFGDEMLFELGVLRSDGLDFCELREQALLCPDTWLRIDEQDFSAGIREGRAGFSDGIPRSSH
jgi:Ca2+/Na+ antiporter